MRLVVGLYHKGHGAMVLPVPLADVVQALQDGRRGLGGDRRRLRLGWRFDGFNDGWGWFRDGNRLDRQRCLRFRDGSRLDRQRCLKFRDGNWLDRQRCLRFRVGNRLDRQRCLEFMVVVGRWGNRSGCRTG